MQTFNVEFRPSASADLLNIFDYLFEITRSSVIARGFVLRIRARCLKIGNAPYEGRSRDDLEMGLRIVPFEKTGVIAYVIEGDNVWIVNIFYGGRDFEAFYIGIS